MPLGGEGEHVYYLDQSFGMIRSECMAVMASLDNAYGIAYDPHEPFGYGEYDMNAFTNYMTEFASGIDQNAVELTRACIAETRALVAVPGMISAQQNLAYQFPESVDQRGEDVSWILQNIQEAFPHVNFGTWSPRGIEGVIAQYVTHDTASGAEISTVEVKKNWWVDDVDPFVRLRVLCGYDANSRAVYATIELHVNQDPLGSAIHAEAFGQTFNAIGDVLGNINTFMGEAAAQGGAFQSVTLDPDTGELSFVMKMPNSLDPAHSCPTVKGSIDLSGKYHITIDSIIGATLPSGRDIGEGASFLSLANFLDWAGIKFKVISALENTLVWRASNGQLIRLIDVDGMYGWKWVPDKKDKINGGHYIQNSEPTSISTITFDDAESTDTMFRYDIAFPLRLIGSDIAFESTLSLCVDVDLTNQNQITLRCKDDSGNIFTIGIFDVSEISTKLNNIAQISSSLENLLIVGKNTRGFMPTFEMDASTGELTVKLNFYLSGGQGKQNQMLSSSSAICQIDIAKLATSSDAVAYIRNLPVNIECLDGSSRTTTWTELQRIFSFYEYVTLNDKLHYIGTDVGSSTYHMMFSSLEFTQDGIDVGLYVPWKMDLKENLQIAFSDAAPNGIISQDGISYGDYATWLECYYVKQCNPDWGSSTASPWMPDFTIVLDDPSNPSGSRVFSGYLRNTGDVALRQDKLGDGWIVLSTSYSQEMGDIGNVYPSFVAYLSYCMHRSGGYMDNQWSLYRDGVGSLDDPLCIRAMVEKDYGTTSVTGTVFLFYDPVTGMYAYGTRYILDNCYGQSQYRFFTPMQAIMVALKLSTTAGLDIVITNNP